MVVGDDDAIMAKRRRKTTDGEQQDPFLKQKRGGVRKLKGDDNHVTP